MHFFHRRDESVVTRLWERAIEFAVGVRDGEYQRSDGDVSMLQDERGDEGGRALLYRGGLICGLAGNFEKLGVAKDEFECLGSIMNHVLRGDIFDPFFE